MKKSNSKSKNVCEHGDHPAAEGHRFCSRDCERCESTDHDATKSDCAGVCGIPPVDLVKLARRIEKRYTGVGFDGVVSTVDVSYQSKIPSRRVRVVDVSLYPEGSDDYFNYETYCEALFRHLTESLGLTTNQGQSIPPFQLVAERFGDARQRKDLAAPGKVTVFWSRGLEIDLGFFWTPPTPVEATKKTAARTTKKTSMKKTATRTRSTR